MSSSQKIGLFSATIIGINAMIGAGIFAMPALLASVAGPASIFSYVISSVFILSIVFSLGRLAQIDPGEGWGYRYPARWGGHLVGLVSSLMYIGGVIIAMGFLTQQAGIWLAPYSSFSSSTLGVGVLGLLVALVLAGAEISAWGQYVIAACVLIPMGLTSLLCWMHFKPALVTPFVPYGATSIFTALPIVIFSLLGFESIASLYSVVRNAQRTVPRAAILSVCTVVGMYILFVSGAFFAIAPSFFKAGVSEAFSEVLLKALPQYPFLPALMSVGAFFAIFGTLHSMIWSVAVLLFDVIKRVRATAVSGLVSQGILTPQVCVLITGATTLYCALGISAEKIVPLTPLFIVPAYLFSIVALLADSAEWRAGRNTTALVGFASCCVLLYYSVTALL